MRLTTRIQKHAKWAVVVICATMAMGIVAEGWIIGTSTVEVPLRKFGSAQRETPETLSRYSRDDALGGGMTVLGTYYIEVKANGHSLRLQLDTGSSMTYLPSDSCTIYSGDSAVRPCVFFNKPLAMSETSEVGCDKKRCKSCSGGCLFSTQYQDGTSVYAHARLVNMTLGSVSSSSVVGLVYRSTKGFRYDAGTQIDGLIGLGRYRASSSFSTVLDDWMRSRGHGNAFSMQLGPMGGALSLGGYNPSYFSGEIFWTPLLDHSSWYRVPLPQISVGDKVVQYSKQIAKAKAVVDSGTTYVLVPTDVFSQIASFIASFASSSCSQAICGPMPSTIFYTGRCSTDIDLQSLPEIRLTFERKMTIAETKQHKTNPFTLVLTPRQYTYLQSTQNGKECRAYALGIGPNDVFVLGDTFMTSYYSIFDQQNMRVGFATSTHASNVLPTNEPVTLTRDPNYASASTLLASFCVTFIAISTLLLISL